MTASDLVQVVTAAQAGDVHAFSALVTRFANMATSYAVGVLGDLDAAEDAAQEAFVEAYQKLSQLREPRAFPRWLRRIVYKRCDRRLRRRPPAPPAPAPAPAAEEALERARARAWVRAAVEGLPEHERIAVALHYFGESAQAEVADFLELPLSTVKKRLFSARRRLEAQRSKDMPLDSTRTPTFTDRIALFVAIRSGDHREVDRVLDRHPRWIDEPEQWTRAEALATEIPLAHRLTPLVLAAGRGDLALVERLLARGAQVDARCGCEAGETALFAAVTHGRVDVARRLLEAGADPHAQNHVGHTPASVAALRGLTEISALFRGAKGALAPAGPTPLARQGAQLVTGIKAVDLLAPLAPGMLVRVHAAAETGLMVLMAELSARLVAQGWRVRWTSWAVHAWQRDELRDWVAQMGLQDRVAVSSGGFAADGPRGEDGLAHFVFRSEGLEAEVDVALPELAAPGGLAFVVDPWIPVTRSDRAVPTLTPPFGAVLVTDPEMAAEGLFPALDIARTTSALPLDEAQAELRARVRAAARDPRVRSFTSQPFFVCQHDTGMAGVDVPLDETREGFRRLLEGEGPEDPAALRYLAALPRA